MAGVACASGLFDFEEKGVLVAIDVEADDFLGVAAGFAFEPVLLAGTAPVVHEAGLEGGLERGWVHPGHHEDPLGGCVLDNGGDEAVGVVFQGQIHGFRK